MLLRGGLGTARRPPERETERADGSVQTDEGRGVLNRRSRRAHERPEGRCRGDRRGADQQLSSAARPDRGDDDERQEQQRRHERDDAFRQLLVAQREHAGEAQWGEDDTGYDADEGGD